MPARLRPPVLCALLLLSAPALAPVVSTEPDRAERGGLALAPQPGSSLAARPAAPPSDYVEGEWLVEVSDVGQADEIAAAAGAELLGLIPRAGLLHLRSADPSGLRGDPRVLGVAPNARTSAAGRARWQASQLQWFRQEVGLPTRRAELSGVVVAVLDSGMAHWSPCDTISFGGGGGGGGVDGMYGAGARSWELSAASPQARGQCSGYAAASLNQSALVAPYDVFWAVQEAYDDHQHGTHITSLIASDGEVDGVAPGVTLMPVRVLDHRAWGTEAGLIAGIYWAVDHGADVINMSLAFGPSYVPSRGLLEAMQAADEAGVVMVAASGNEGRLGVAWPAASPLAVAVGASSMTEGGGLNLTSYSNAGPRVDLIAPGGAPGADANHDSYMDGMLAETISYQNPYQLGYWFMVGTSQATAMVSGAAAWLVAAGVPGEQIPALLRSGALALPGGGTLEGMGSGTLDISGSLALVGEAEALTLRGAGLSLMPWIERRGGDALPVADLRAVDEVGLPLAGATLYGQFSGSTNGVVSCQTDGAGQCRIQGPAAPAVDSEGQEAALAWAVEVGTLQAADGRVTHPGRLIYAHPLLEELAQAWQSGVVPDGSLLGLVAGGPEEEELEVMDAWAVVDGGAGISTSPMGLVFTPRALEGAASVQVVDSAAGGAGIATSPMQFALITFNGQAALGGSGIATSPMGLLQGIQVAVVQQVGEVGGASLTEAVLGGAEVGGSAGALLWLNEPLAAEVEGMDALSLLLEQGGWVSLDGYQGASVIGGFSGMLHGGSVGVSLMSESGGLAPI